MSLGQTMISAAFFVLLTLAVLSANKMILENTKYYLQEEAIEQASNFANALISEILTKKFDSKVVDSSGIVIGPYNSSNLPWPSGVSYATRPTLFDAASNMGTSAATENNVMPGGNPDTASYKSIRGDSPSWFDDVDDYKGYVRTANSADISGYRLTVNVYYVLKSDPSTATSFQTYYKRIDVSVTHPIYLTKALTFSAIATY